MENVASYRPSAHYYRGALRAARSTEEAIDIGLHLVGELELLRHWVRSQGLIPPKWYVMQSERDAKGWGSVVLFPKTVESSATEAQR